jgi:type IX secretion system substrate protein
MKIALYILAFFISVSVFAQPKLGMYTTYSITPANATGTLGIVYTSTISIKCFVQNKGNAVFNGSFVLYKAVQSGTMQTLAVPVSTVTTALNTNDTIRVTFTDSIKPSDYKVSGNGNTIVVWPVSSSALTTDSLFTAPVYVNDPTGIKELDRHKLFLYPNPVTQTLFLMPESGVEYKDIIIYDLQMKMLMQMPYTEKIEVGLLPSGTYIIMVSDSKGARYGSRFTKND